MQVTIDKNSGYCFGVEFAIQMAEDELAHESSSFIAWATLCTIAWKWSVCMSMGCASSTGSS